MLVRLHGPIRLCGLLVGIAALGACALSPAAEDPRRAQNVGEYTPGYVVNAQARAAVSGEDGGAASAGSFNSCFGTDIDTHGSTDGQKPADCLTIDVVTKHPRMGMLTKYDIKGPGTPNDGAAWIENDKGEYAVGLEHWGIRFLAQGNAELLLFHHRNACPDGPDAISQPTLIDYGTHHLVWKCQDVKGQVVPDGNYVLWLEVQVDDGTSIPAASFPFVKGPEPWTMTFGETPISQSATLTYTPIK